MLQTRIFSYADTQRYRLGPNYLMLPVNAPKNVHHNNHHDGVMNFMHRDEEVSHFASRDDMFTDMLARTCMAQCSHSCLPEGTCKASLLHQAFLGE